MRNAKEQSQTSVRRMSPAGRDRRVPTVPCTYRMRNRSDDGEPRRRRRAIRWRSTTPRTRSRCGVDAALDALTATTGSSPEPPASQGRAASRSSEPIPQAAPAHPGGGVQARVGSDEGTPHREPPRRSAQRFGEWFSQMRRASRVRARVHGRRRPDLGSVSSTAPTNAPAAATLPSRTFCAASGSAAIAWSTAAPSAPSSDTTASPRASTTSSGEPSPATTPSSTWRASLSLSFPDSTSSTMRATCAGVTGNSDTSTPRSFACRASSPIHHL